MCSRAGAAVTVFLDLGHGLRLPYAGHLRVSRCLAQAVTDDEHWQTATGLVTYRWVPMPHPLAILAADRRAPPGTTMANMQGSMSDEK